MELWLLLPAGLIIGWLLADKFQLFANKTRKIPNISKEYFKGLNYIINEEQDKAILIFSQMLADNPKTVETQIALGTLFRRRGESARAISIHKSLIEDNSLSPNQTKEALLELGRDYTNAGMLDRAVAPFEELLKFPEYKKDALLYLAQIYDQEHDWSKAITTVDELFEISEDDKWRIVSSHYYCEQAEQEIKANKLENANKLLDIALDKDNSCARANIIKAKLLQQQNNHQAALDILKKIETQLPIYIPEILPDLLRSYERIATTDTIVNYLQQLLTRNPSTSLMLALVGKVKLLNGHKPAEELLIKILQDRPTVRGLEFLIGFNLDQEPSPENKARLQGLRKMMAKLQAEKPTYMCCHCGFQAYDLYWQCPGCRNWNTIEPVVGVTGE